MAESRTLTETAAGGSLSVLLGQAVRIVAQFASFIVLGRLLTPSDFGLVAMVSVFVGLAAVFSDFGFSAAVLRAPVLDRRIRDTLFYLNATLGGLFAVCLWTSAPLIANYYGDQRISAICRWLALAVMGLGLVPQYRAELSRRMNFKWLSWADPTAQVTGLCAALVAAEAGAGYWSLVIQQLTVTTTLLVYCVASTRYFPRSLPTLRGMGEHVSLSLSVFSLQATSYAATSTGTLVLGNTSGTTVAGIYSRAAQLVSLPVTQVAGPLTRVAVPVIARVESVTMSLTATRMQRIMCWALLPVLASVAGGGGALFQVLMGNQWEGSGRVAELLALGATFQVLGYIHYWLFLALGRVKVLMFCELPVWTGFVTVVFLAQAWNPTEIACLYACCLGLIWVLGLVLAPRQLAIQRRALLVPILWPALTAAAIYVGSVSGRLIANSSNESAPVVLLAEAVAALIAATSMLSFGRLRSDMSNAASEFRRRRITQEDR